MRINTIVNKTMDAKSYARSIIHQGYTWGMLRRELHNKWLEYEQTALKGVPYKYTLLVSGYFEGLLDSMQKDIVFLYCVDGQYYKIRDKDINLPEWDTLPRDMWDKLGECGNMYYKGMALNGIYKVFY